MAHLTSAHSACAIAVGAAYTCVAVTSLTAAFTFRNFEAAMVMLLQAALLSMIGCIVRPRMPDDVYNDGQKASVQSSQMVAVITGWIGAFGPLVAVLLKQTVPTPVEYITEFVSRFTNQGEPKE